MKLIIAFIAGMILTYWVNPFSQVTMFTEVHKQVVEARSDSYKKCQEENATLTESGQFKVTWKCGTQVFYTISKINKFYKEARK